MVTDSQDCWSFIISWPRGYVVSWSDWGIQNVLSASCWRIYM